jgi:uncharacterized protein (TIGR00725 family)
VASKGAWIAVVGPGRDATPADLMHAEDAGAAVAEAGAVLVCGGLGGVMEAACRGARSRGGLTVGVLPGVNRDDANGWVVVALPTGLGEGRNALIVHAADAIVSVGGGWGTLSEIALGLRAGRPVIGVDTWDIARAGVAVDGVVEVEDGRAAVGEALRRLGHGGQPRVS